MARGYVNANYAKSVVMLETGGLSDEQFGRIKYVLGETFGSMMIKELANKRLEVSWPAQRADDPKRLFSRKKPITPERLREIILQQLEAHAASIDIDVSQRY